MQSKVARLRAVCWIGAFVDLIFAIAMITPSLWSWMLGIGGYDPTLIHRLDMGVGASLMFGWTMLLLWASHNPVERRGVIALTIFPVITGLGITSALAIYTGVNSIGNLIWVFGMKVILVAIFAYGFLAARRLAAEAA